MITTSFAVPAGALGRWHERLTRSGVTVERSAAFGEEILAFEDPDGLSLEPQRARIQQALPTLS